MLEPWNDAALLRPPVHTFLVPKKDFFIREGNINRISQACARMTNILSKQAPLHQEGALVSRFLYKFDMKFRCDIGYRQLKKVNSAVRKYLSLNIYKDIEQFASVLPSTTDDLYLPTKQMLEYILVRLITFTKLMIRISVCSKQGSVFYLNRVKRGESHWMSLMPYALLCRMWSISTVMIQHACQWYSQLFSCLGTLEAKGLPFLPLKYELPSNLAEWLDTGNIDNIGRFQWSHKLQLVLDTSVLIDEDSNTIENVILQYVSQINEDNDNQETELLDCNINNEIKKDLDLNISKNVPNEMFPTSLSSIDKGVVLSRDSFIVSNSTKVLSHTTNNITTIKDLQDFLDKEDAFRSNGNEQSLTKHLSFMQWLTLKNCLTKLLTSLDKSRKIKKKFQKIWKEKCLDYK